MTAYVNDEQKKEGAYGKAVKATLAATLAVGMVPAVAVADEANDAAAEGNDVETLAASPAELWQNGVFTFEDVDGNAVEVTKDAQGNYKTVEFEYNKTNQLLVPVSVDPEGGDATDAEYFDKNANYTVKYEKVTTDDDGKITSTADVTDWAYTIGMNDDHANKNIYFQVTVTANAGNYKGATQTFKFKFVQAESDFSDATLYEVGAKDDYSDKTFAYTGKEFTYGTAAGNVGLLYKGAAATGVKSLEFYGSNGKVEHVYDAGTYTVVAVMSDNTKVTLKQKLVVDKLDLSKAEYTFGKSGDFGNHGIETVAGNKTFDTATVKNVAIAELFDITCAWPNSMDGTAVGDYTYTIKPKAEASADAKKVLANITGEGTAVDTNYAKGCVDLTDNIYYGSNKLAGTANVNLTEGEKFDLSKISVKDGETAIKADYYEVTVYDEDGNAVDKAKLNETGKWTVKVKVNSGAADYLYKGEAKCVVTVTNGEVATKDVVFSIDGKAVAGTASVDYDGTDALEKLVVTAKIGNKELVRGTDFQVVAYKDGEKVDKVVEKGVYTVKLTSDKYDFAQKEELVLTVNAIKANDLRIAPASLLHGDETTTEIGYTGSAIVPVVQYNTGKLDDDGKEIWKDLPAGTYKLSYDYKKKDADNNFDAVKEMKELGSYKVTVKDADKNDSIEVKNGVLKDSNDKAIVFKVVEGKVYADVAPSDWYYEYVYGAQDAGYMKGIGDSDIFAPNESTTRAMAAVVLSRMAVEGGAQKDTYTNPFTDIEYSANAVTDPWYTNGVLWANATGIVKGYPGTTEFRPDAEVTRAEFCVMMQRYANATDQGVALEAGEADEILAGYEDGAAVPAWCKDAVAWAVKNKIFGGYTVLNPDGNITRAEMAKMTVAFQADPLKEKAPATN